MSVSGDINKQACRVCLKENAQTLHIFEKPSHQNQCFASMLTAIADVKILKGDSLPQNLCIPCSEVLIKAYKLKVLAEKTNAFLQLKSKQIIIKELKKYIKIEPGEKDLFKNDDIFTATAEHIESDMFNEAPTKRKSMKNCDIFSEPIPKNTKKIALKDDIFFNDNNINENESLFGNDDHFADNDDFHISSSSKSVTKKKTFKAPVTKKTKRQSAKEITPVKRKVQILKKSATFKKKFVPKLKTKFVPKAPNRAAESDSEKFVCSVCGLLVSNIVQHMKTHKEHRFQCPVCKVGFEKKSEYHLHTITHGSTSRNHICDVCPLRFFTRKALIRHKLNHSEKRFECDHCSFKFICRWTLKRHMKTHLGLKPFVCECGQAFMERFSLAQHVRTHTGERLYECQICNLDFSYKYTLNKHVLNTHGVNIRFQSLHKVTEEGLRLLAERVVAEGLCEGEQKSKMYVHRNTRRGAFLEDDD